MGEVLEIRALKNFSLPILVVEKSTLSEFFLGFAHFNSIQFRRKVIGL